MSQELEDMFSPEDEAHIQREAIKGKITDDIAVFRQMVDSMKQNPRDVEPEVWDAMQEALASYQAWMKQQGIGMQQPDVDI
ncbi:hypothetical protein OUO20_13665 [Arthrobacter sp. FX8]|uniref:hypothetical protein n=1 Tax=Arthrobacter sp. FX8 TaxID=2997335 RepID=UPI00227BE2D3|nr:hypothetical protein [Arthrobacter sp. FX8]WAJ32206.1 hypothetical protein OUO20_13665 [Arthrobacter sp. FX8]